MSRAAMKHGPRGTSLSQNDSPADRLRPLLLGALVAIFVARPLLVSESAATVAGDGLPFVMLTLVLAIAWWAAATVRPRFPARLGWVDLAWLALIVWQAAGTLIVVRTGAARAAINVCWEWVGLALAFVLLRQLIADDRELRALVVVMIALAVVLSAYGLFQFYVSLPAVREQYDRDPDAVLRSAGVIAPPGSPARLLFRERLKSTEPMATFALANSLAGFLAPWLIVLVGVAWLARADGQDAASVGRRWAIAAAAALPIAVCLILTKSRSAYGASLLGMAGIAVARRTIATPAAPNRRVVVFVAAAVIVVLIAIAIGGRALDREIFTEATKSLSYRWHYWHAALEIIRDHPWFGCGLGNFQDIYTQYKLPEASEVVADPHNFLLEIWSTSGTPAVLALLAIFIAAAVELRRRGHSAATALKGYASSPFGASAPTNAGVYAVMAGAVGGFALAFLVGLFSMVALPLELMTFGSLAIVVAALAARRWIECGTLPRGVPLVALAALLVNLLAAGGIGFAGVAGSLWLLLAIALCLDRSGRPSGERSSPDCAPAGSRLREKSGRGSMSRPEFSRILLHRLSRVSGGGCVIATRPFAAVLLAASIAVAAICYYSAYLPVLNCRILQAQANADPAGAEQDLRAAAAADPLADEPWKNLAALAMNRWRHEVDPRWLRFWKDAQVEILRRRPQSSAAWHQAADGFFEIYRQTHRNDELTRAIDHYRRAVELYPNHALGHAHLAQALSSAGHTDDARIEAADALRLHRLTPHADQKLPEDTLAEIEAIAGSTL